MGWYCEKNIFEENITDTLYMDFLQNTFISDTQLFLDIQIANNFDSKIGFQRNGAPSHYARAFKQSLSTSVDRKKRNSGMAH